MEVELIYAGGIDGNLLRVGGLDIIDSFGDFSTCTVRHQQKSTGNQGGG